MNFHRIDIVELERIAHTVLSMLWRSSWQAGVLAGAVLALQLLLGKRLAPRWRHAMWWIVLLRLLVPVTPPSPFSLFNIAPEQPAAVDRGIVLIVRSLPQPLAASRAADHHWMILLATIWLIGVLWLLLRILGASVFLSIAVRKMNLVRDPHILSLLNRCRGELHIRRDLEILSSSAIGAPALMGFLRPRLLLPPTVLENFDAAELRLILLHELAHLKRHDVAINWLASILQAVHWFNPVVWLAFARLRSDRELAADELVLSLAGDEQRGHYGQTLVKLLQTLSRRPMLAGTVGILERAHPMRRRITMIAQFHRHAPRWALTAAVSLLILAALGLTDCVRGQAPDKSAAGGAAATRPAANDVTAAALKETVAELMKAGHPPSPEVAAQARENMIAKIRSQALVINSQGQTVNQKEVDGLVAQAGDRLEKMLADWSHHASAAPGVASVSATTSSSVDDERVRALLQKRLPEVNFNAIAFSDVIDFLRDVTGANITVNWRALESAGVDRSAPCTLRLKDVTFEQAMNHLLRDVGGGTVKVSFGVGDGSVLVSTEEELSQHVQLRTFIVTDLLQEQDKGSAKELVSVILQQVSSPNMVVSAYHDRLVVKGSSAELQQVEVLLSQLRNKPEGGK